MASIRKLADGRWQAQFRPIPGGKQVTRTTHGKAEVQRWLDEQKALAITGHFVDPGAGRITVGVFYKSWSERQVWAPTTRQTMNASVRSITFADVPLRLLRRSHIESWVKHMETSHSGNGKARYRDKEGLRPSTIRSRLRCVRIVLRAAVADKRIATDPSNGVKSPRVQRGSSTMTLPTPEQVGALLNAAEPQFRAYIAVCAFAGLRRSEAAGLQISDLDFSAGSLAVKRQWQYVHLHGHLLRPPKYSSERTVYLPDELLHILSDHIRRLSADDANPWLFRGVDGKPILHNTLNYLWRKAKRRAGAPAVRLHDLRHFFASGLIASGCDVVTVQRALGHANAGFTLSTYAHLWPNSEDRTRQAIAGMLAEAMDDGADERLTNDPEAQEAAAGQPGASTGLVEPKSTTSFLEPKATDSSFRGMYDKP